VFVLVEDDDKKDMRVKKRITKRKRSHQLHFIHAFSNGRFNLFRHRPSTSSFRVLLLSAVNGNLSSLSNSTERTKNERKNALSPCSGSRAPPPAFSVILLLLCMESVRERERERERERRREKMRCSVLLLLLK
jgi:hypothetical protein